MKLGQILEQRGINIRGNIVIAKERDITSIMKAKVRRNAASRVVQTTKPALPREVKGEALIKRFPDLSMDEYMRLTTDDEIKMLLMRSNFDNVTTNSTGRRRFK